jgi:hypothetical protein
LLLRARVKALKELESRARVDYLSVTVADLRKAIESALSAGLAENSYVVVMAVRARPCLSGLRSCLATHPPTACPPTSLLLHAGARTTPPVRP